MPSPGRLAGAERLVRRPDRFTLLLIAIAMLGAGLVLAREATWGVSLSWDSVQYVATARNLADHPLEFIQTGGAHRDEDAYRFWPPLYPVLLAAGTFGALDPLDVAGPLNAIAFGLIVFVAGRWLRRWVRSRFLLAWGCLALMLAHPVAGIAAWAMSEPPFILFALLALLRAEAHLRGGKRSALLQAAVFTALACLTRYMGVAVLATVVLLLLFHWHGPSPAERRRAIAAYAFLSIVPLALWLVRNVLVLGEPVGNRIPVDYSLPEVLGDLLIVTGKWAVPLDSGWWGPAAALAVLAAGAAVMGVRSGKTVAAIRLNPALGWFSLSFIILHLVAMMSGNTWHGVDERHLLPVYIPLLLVALSVLDQAKGGVSSAGLFPSRMKYVPMAALSLWMVSGLAANLQDVREANARPGDPGNYASGQWRNSGIMESIVPDPERGIYSNYPAALYIHRPGFREYGELKGQIATGYHDNLPRFVGEIANEGDYLVWFHSPVHPRFDYDDDDLRALPGLDLVAEADDGALFRIRR